MASFAACEKHGGHLYPVDGECDLCVKGVHTADVAKRETEKQSAKTTTGNTRKF